MSQVRYQSNGKKSPFLAVAAGYQLESKSEIREPVKAVWLKSRRELETISK